MSNAVRLSSEMIEAAREEATLTSRSLTGQAEHWMRLGKAFEQGQSPLLRQILADQIPEQHPTTAELRELLRGPRPDLDVHYQQMAENHRQMGYQPGDLGDIE